MILCMGYRRGIPALLGYILVCFSTAALSYGQQLNSSELRISSPSSGAVVNPGQAGLVVVTPAMGVALTHVFVVGEYPILGTGIIDVSPFQFSLVPPIGARLGKYMLTAWGVDGSGQTVVSSPVSIDLEPSSTPSTLSIDPPRLYFQSQGQMIPLRVTATFTDGSTADATESSNVAYASGNAGLARVTSTGLVTAISSGATSVTVAYGTSNNLKITVPVSVQAAGLAMTPTSLAFPSQRIGGRSASQSLTVTNRSNSPIIIKGLTASGGFDESDDCASTSPLAAGAFCTANVVFAPSKPGATNGSLTVSDRFDGISPSISLSGMALAAPNFSLSATPGSAMLGFGQPASYSLTITPIGGFKEAVLLSCSGAPSGTTCSISRPLITLNGSSPAIATVTVSPGSGTMAGSLFHSKDGRYSFRYMVLAVIVFPLLCARKTRFAVAILITALATACGNGNYSSQVLPGTYTLTLQATSGSISQNEQVRLIVD